MRKILFCTENDLHSYKEYLEKEDQVLRGEEALSLLLEILCGLHSPIVGETEVFGQFKNFVDSRKQIEDWIFCDQQKWLQFIMAEVKKTRAEHLVGLGSQSYGSLLRKYTKEIKTVSVCGSGHLAQEILPWLSQKESLQVLCREPAKLQSFEQKYKYNNLNITSYQTSDNQCEAIVIAAPLSDEQILQLVAKQSDNLSAIFDLRGEENNLPSLLSLQNPSVSFMGLNQFFAEMEETKKDTQMKIQTIKQSLFEKAV
ncbi:MAG: hypothetical protein ACXWRZ_16245, partial [Bdellovibrio sp.]